MAREELLGRCFVEGDAATQAKERRARLRALGTSLGVQAALLGMLIIVPLLAVAELPRVVRILTPLPPTKGDPTAPPRTQQHPPGGGTQSSSSSQAPRIPPAIVLPSRIPELTYVPEDYEGPPQIGAGPREQGPSGQGVPWGIDLPELGTRGPQPPPVEQPKPRVSGPVAVSEPVQAARLIRKVEPVFPPIALIARREGKVELRAIIDREGFVRQLTVVSGDPLFVQEARRAISQWRYQPTLLNGQAVEVDTYITVVFKLHR